MIDFVAEELLWVVLIEKAELIPVDIGQQFTSNQLCEIFTDKEQAEERALEVGWEPEEIDFIFDPPEEDSSIVI